jgi:hypothetical protein
VSPKWTYKTKGSFDAFARVDGQTLAVDSKGAVCLDDEGKLLWQQRGFYLGDGWTLRAYATPEGWLLL